MAQRERRVAHGGVAIDEAGGQQRGAGKEVIFL
jgi:hypothetical protein